jgi:hypothetical protein
MWFSFRWDDWGYAGPTQAQTTLQFGVIESELQPKSEFPILVTGGKAIPL